MFLGFKTSRLGEPITNIVLTWGGVREKMRKEEGEGKRKGKDMTDCLPEGPPIRHFDFNNTTGTEVPDFHIKLVRKFQSLKP